MSDVSLDEVRHVAALANLQLTPEEEPRMQHDLNAILAYVAQLGELDTTGVEPMAQVGDLLASAGTESANAQDNAGAGELLRGDAVRPSVDRRAVMGSAPETDGRFFKVPRVLER